MKAHQRIIREKKQAEAASENLFGAWWVILAVGIFLFGVVTGAFACEIELPDTTIEQIKERTL